MSHAYVTFSKGTFKVIKKLLLNQNDRLVYWQEWKAC